MSNAFKMIFTAISDGGGAVTSVQVLVERGDEIRKSRLLAPGEFAELMLASHVFPPVEAEGLFLRVKERGILIEENVTLTEKQMQFLCLAAC